MRIAQPRNIASLQRLGVNKRLSELLDPRMEANELLANKSDLSTDDIRLLNDIAVVAPDLDGGILGHAGNGTAANPFDMTNANVLGGKLNFDVRNLPANPLTISDGPLIGQSILASALPGLSRLNTPLHATSGRDAADNLSQFENNVVQQGAALSTRTARDGIFSSNPLGFSQVESNPRAGGRSEVDVAATERQEAWRRDDPMSDDPVCNQLWVQIANLEIEIKSLKARAEEAEREAQELFAQANAAREAADEEIRDAAVQAAVQLAFRKWKDALQDGGFAVNKWAREQRKVTKSGIEELATGLYEYHLQLNRQRGQKTEERIEAKKKYDRRGCGKGKKTNSDKLIS